MAILTRQAILEAINDDSIKISNFNIDNLGVNSYDLTLHPVLTYYEDGVILDPRKLNPVIDERIPEDGYVLNPGKLYLARVNEFTFSNKYVFEIQGKSTLARLGITVHETASYSNLGHGFNYVLEISVVHPVVVYPNMKIAQIYVHTVHGPVELYDGHYKESQGFNSDNTVSVQPCIMK